MTVYVLSLFYIYVGIKHFIDPYWFVQIMPPYLPYHLELVYLSGFFEVFLGLFLLFSKSRKYAAYGIILLLIAVYPANIYLAFNDLPQKALDISSFAASWIRLPIQFVLIGVAFWHSQ
ncbi:MAG: DoxX family protein [Candidatus Marinimicrobia bacterium]|nr:DoxX family protein [Candidatus Neomarinimicrobiota bacterium]